jgi:hypothetical protein
MIKLILLENDVALLIDDVAFSVNKVTSSVNAATLPVNQNVRARFFDNDEVTEVVCFEVPY